MMYEYYNGLVIRAGRKNLPTYKIKNLYLSVGWASTNLPSWQDEKFILFFENSTWAFTIWDKNELIGMVRVISDKIAIATICDLAVSPTYQGKGLGRKLVELCLQKLPHGNWFAHTTKENYEFYRKCGFKIPDESSTKGTCTYFGFAKARIDGHRI